MQRLAFKMQLKKGFEEEYKKRHDVLWPDLEKLLKSTGISDYSIYLDEDTLALFACMNVQDVERLQQLPTDPVMKKWWAYMSDIMETHSDHSPVSIPLKPVFYLP